MNGKPFSHRERSQGVAKNIYELINENDEDIHVLFSQLDILTTKDDALVWREAARWVKYEEDVEENGKRWSKPHVASITLHNIFELRSQLANGVVALDVDVKSIPKVADLIIKELCKSNSYDESTLKTIRSILVTQHFHPHLKRRRDPREHKKKSVLGQCGQPMTSSFNDVTKGRGRRAGGKRTASGGKREPLVEFNKPFMKKIPDGAEAANVWVGEVDDLKHPVTAFIRLSEPRTIGDLTEVPLPTKFIFVHLVPPGVPDHIFEIGRAMSTMFVDEIFSEIAYKAKTREDIMHGMDEFLDQVTVLPPGQWDPKIRLDPPTSVPSQDRRRTSPGGTLDELDEEDEDDSHGDPTLVRSGRIFGGLINDVKRKIPFYLSDFKDGLHIQCIASILYMYLATLTPNITFGALLGLSTDHFMGPMECIVTIAFVNISWALFSGQPLIIMGSTGPVLVIEGIIYTMCRDAGWEFLPFRLWIGVWTTFILMVMVAFDLSSLVRYITRFTEESFACLIGIIFIVEAFSKIFAVADEFPFNRNPDVPLDYTCECIAPNMTDISDMLSNVTTHMPSVDMTTLPENWTILSKEDCEKYGGSLVGTGCDTVRYYDNVFFMSFILGIGTFTIAWTLVNMKRSSFFPTFVRQILGDFAVFISICLMVGLDVWLGVKTPKLSVPDRIEPSRPDRGWFVSPFSEQNPWWTCILAALPAIVAVILMFMDQQITAVIINRKENKLKKGSGYHLDLTVCSICILGCSLCGLPWYVAATVRSMAHVNSLKKESECTAPGEKSVFLGCREQRVTPFIVAVLNGCSVFMTGILQLVPMPVLYGVFLYMGVSSLRGQQFIDRILIMFMPAKYQPDHMYLRHVRTKRVHLFTVIQILCLVILWIIKAIKSISIVFPVMVLGTCFVRKAMERFFTRNELLWLDDLMPEDKMMKKEDAGELIVDDDDMDDDDDEEKTLELIRLQKYRKSIVAENVEHLPWTVKDEGTQTRTSVYLEERRRSSLIGINKESKGLQLGSHKEEKGFLLNQDDDEDMV